MQNILGRQNSQWFFVKKLELVNGVPANLFSSFYMINNMQFSIQNLHKMCKQNCTTMKNDAYKYCAELLRSGMRGHIIKISKWCREYLTGLCRVPRNSSWIILEIWIQWRVFLWNSNLGWENRKVSLCPLILCSQNKVLTFRLFLLENFQINNFGKNTLFWVGALTAWLNCVCKMQQW